jgi:CHAD domain-containing protein
MGYRFRHDDESVEAGFRRIAGEQLGRAVKALEGDALHAGVHDARKRVKKVRGLLRLVRPGFKGFARENAALRDAARTLSGLRDHAAMIEALDRLMARYPARVDAARMGPLRAEMEARRDDAAGANDLPDRIAAFREVLGAAEARTEGWRLKAAAGWEALGPGLARIYGEGREAMAVAHKTGRGEDFHEFRKRVKDHGYHARLLAPVWPVLMEPYATLLDDLGEVLGEQHDLVAFAPVVTGSGLAPEARNALEDLIVEERRRLEARALVMGARVYAERPKAMARRMGAWWAAWAADPSAVDQDDEKEPPSAASISAMLSSIP